MFRMKNKTLDENAGEKLKNDWGLYTILLVALGSMTFFGVCTPSGPNNTLSGNAAEVDGEKVNFYEFRRAYSQETERMRQQYGEDFKPEQLQVSKRVVDKLVSELALYQEAIRMGLQATEDEVVSMLAEVEAFKDESGVYSDERFQNYLKFNRYTEASFLEEMRRNMTIQKLRNFVTSSTFASSKSVELDYKLSETKLQLEYVTLNDLGKDIAVSDAEVTEFLTNEENKAKVEESYNSRKADYNTPEKVKASHVLVSFEGARNASGEGAKRSKEDARKKAESLIPQLKAGNFAEIAKKETDEPSGKNSGGDLGFFTKEAMVQAFSDAAFALNKGEISGVVESPFGFHIIKVFDKQEAKSISLEEAQNDLAKKLVKEEKAPKIVEEKSKEILTALAAGNNDILNTYGLKWEKTSSFPIQARSIPGIGSAEDLLPKLKGLSKSKPLLEEVIDTGVSKVIVKLADKTSPDMSKFDDETKEQLSRSSSFTQGYFMFNNFQQAVVKRMEDDKKIFRNPAFENFDANNASQANQDG